MGIVFRGLPLLPPVLDSALVARINPCPFKTVQAWRALLPALEVFGDLCICFRHIPHSVGVRVESW